MVVIDAGTPPTDPLYDTSHPDEKAQRIKKLSVQKNAKQKISFIYFQIKEEKV